MVVGGALLTASHSAQTGCASSRAAGQVMRLGGRGETGNFGGSLAPRSSRAECELRLCVLSSRTGVTT